MLFCAEDPSDLERGRFWFLPGGGVEVGETPQAAALREIREEVGLSLDPDQLSDEVLRRDVSFAFEGVRYEQSEHYFVTHVGEVQVDETGWTELERRAVVEYHWWDVASLRRAGEPVFPEDLADLVVGLVHLGPPIVTERLVIRPVGSADADAFGTMGLLWVGTDARSWIDENLAHEAEHGFSYWALIETATGGCVGYCGLRTRGSDGVSLGYEIAPGSRGRGLATEAAAVVARWAKPRLGHRLFASVRPPNPASVRGLDKLGMVLAEVQHDGDGPRHIYRFADEPQDMGRAPS